MEAKAAATKTQPTAPVVELMSTTPGSGKTHLLYHLTAKAVLPTDIGGRQACVMIVDADGKFSVPRLAQQMAKLSQSDASHDLPTQNELKDVITTALKHVHVFSPQSMESTVATVRSLPSYLFNANRHHSFDRAVAFIALDSASAFYWQAKAEVENASLLSKQAAPSSGYIPLAAALKNASRTFNTPVIFTCWHLGPIKKSPSAFGSDLRAFRPLLPPPWQTLPTLRLVVQRTAVRKLPVEISVEEALRESEMRQKVVDEGTFECFVNEWGLDERAMQRFQAKGAGFEFRILEESVRFEDVKGFEK